MENLDTIFAVSMFLGLTIIFFGAYKLSRYGFIFNVIIITLTFVFLYFMIRDVNAHFDLILILSCSLLLINIVLYIYLDKEPGSTKLDERYSVQFKLKYGKLKIQNIKRGASIIGAAGSGKTESVVYNFLVHFSQYSFCGIIHDYKNFEITEMAYPLFEKSGIDFRVISFDTIYDCVNPIAPRYMQKEENVNEVSRVLIENLLEQKESGNTGTTKFFTDAAEGLIGGLIWKLKTSYPKYCTLPHLIAIYQLLDTNSLIAFLSTNTTSRAMADAFISGKDSDRQTAGVKSTLANALKKISTQRIFMVLSADDVPLNVNSQERPSVISVVNNPKYETAYSPIIATIIHTITKQISVRTANPSFLIMEEAPTIRLLNMHRIPATLRSYDIATIYVMQDKIQNDMMYGDKASKAILSNLSYQFFGKVNDPDTAKYYERFFEIVKQPTRSISKGQDPFRSDTRVTKGEKEVTKRKADMFFRLKQGEFVAFADGKDRKAQFKLPEIEKRLPRQKKMFANSDLEANFERIYQEVRSIFSN